MMALRLGPDRSELNLALAWHLHAWARYRCMCVCDVIGVLALEQRIGVGSAYKTQ